MTAVTPRRAGWCGAGWTGWWTIGLFPSGKHGHHFFGFFSAAFGAGKVFFFGWRKDQAFKYIFAFFASEFVNRHLYDPLLFFYNIYRISIMSSPANWIRYVPRIWKRVYISFYKNLALKIWKLVRCPHVFSQGVPMFSLLCNKKLIFQYPVTP